MKVDDFVNVMESFVGTTENPPGSNQTPIGAEYGWNGVAWCAETVSVACNRLGFPLHEPSAINIERHARAGDWGMGWSTTPVRGSAAIFDWKGHGNPADMHVGVPKEILENGRFRDIEGNYHDSCQIVLRDMKYVRGFATFPFDAAAPSDVSTPPSAVPAPPSEPPVLRVGISTGAYVQKAQTILRDHAGGNIDVDGIYGPKTEARVKAVQAAFGLTVDGIVGPQTWDILDKLASGAVAMNAPPAPPTPSIFGNHPNENKPVLRRGAKGEFVRYLQLVIARRSGGNIAVDGDFGRQTESRVVDVQRANGASTDGIVGPQTWGIIDRLATS